MLTPRWNTELQSAINLQINKELQASLEYYNISLYFDREDAALDNLSRYFKKMSEEEKEHADMLCRYLNKRGGHVVLTDIPAPSLDISMENDILDSFTKSLTLEQNIDMSLKHLYSKAEEHQDINFCNFLEQFLEEQIVSINELSKQITRLNRLKNDPFGLLYFASNIS